MKIRLALASLVALSLTACATRDFDRDEVGRGGMMDDEDGGYRGGYMMGDHMMFITSDESFIEQMIPHHQEAVDTAKVILARSNNTELKAIAQDIVDSQTAEIEQMRTWYLDWFGGAPSAGMYMAMMPDLSNLEGEELDQAFIKGMIEHHEGAIEMAEQLKDITKRPELLEMADNIITAQTAEVELLKSWLK